MTPKSKRKCQGNIGEAVGKEKELCDEMESVGELTYQGDNVGGGCQVSVNSIKTCGWLRFREHDELQHAKSLPPKLQQGAYRSQ